MTVRDTARRLYESGLDYVTAASKELTTREGFIYAITNEAWPECVKIGRAFDPESRLNGYQTGSPYRDFELHHAVYFTDCYQAEQAVHARLAHLQQEGEWFRIDLAEAAEAIDIIKEII